MTKTWKRFYHSYEEEKTDLRATVEENPKRNKSLGTEEEREKNQGDENVTRLAGAKAFKCKYGKERDSTECQMSPSDLQRRCAQLMNTRTTQLNHNSGQANPASCLIRNQYSELLRQVNPPHNAPGHL